MPNRLIKYGLIGSDGRLGKEVINVFHEQKHLQVLSYNLDEEVITEDPQILIDCSLPDAFDKTIQLVKKFKCPLVIAVTGLNDNQLNKLKRLSKEVPVVQSYNFSAGIQILLKLAAEAYEKLNDWDIEITETHHRFKKDKPSGTAKMIRDVVKKDVNISSLRLGNIAGDHTISFGGLGEVLSISHSAISRRTFAEGILKSAEFAIKKKNGFYSFTDVIFEK
jgi:4-hydroxy-tetrahydrodipicolinate reductase